MKYIKQRHSAACGATAIVNALKWAGEPASLRDTYKRVRDVCEETDPAVKTLGIIATELTPILKQFLPEDITITPVTKTPFTALDKHLVTPNAAAIVAYTWKEEDTVKGHYIFVPHRTKSGSRFTVVNRGPDYPTVSTRTRKSLRTDMTRRTMDGYRYPQVVLLTKITGENQV